MKRSRTGWQRPGGAALLLLTLLLVASSLSSTAHWISTPHRMCALHGQLEDVGPEAAAPLAHEPESVPDAPVYRNEGRAHDECSFVPFARAEVAPVLGSNACGLAPFTGAPVVALTPSVPLPDTLLFHLAPSRSPPA